MTTRATKQAKTGPEMYDLDGDGRRFAVSVDGVIRFAGSREECEKRLEILSRPSSREQQDKRLGRILGAILIGMMVLVPRGTDAASSVNTAVPVQGPYNPAPIRQNFGAAATDITALQRMNHGATAPSAPELGQLWLETPAGQTTYKLRIFDDRTSTWVIVAYFDSLNSLWIAPVGGGLPQTILTSDTTDLGTYPNTVLTVTGAGPVYSFGTTSPAGTVKVLSFNGATNLVYNATSMILPGESDLNTTSGSMAIAVALGSGNWQVMFFQSAAQSVVQGGTGRTSLSAHAVLLGEGTNPVNFATPGTSGYPLLSAGSGSDPDFGPLHLDAAVTGVLPASNGGTGLSSITAHNLMIGTGTSAATLLPPGAVGLPLVSLGAGIDPQYAALSVPGGGTGRTTATAHTVLVANGTSAFVAVGPGANQLPLVGNGGAADPSFRALNLASAGVTSVLSAVNGGTGQASPTAHALLAANGASAMTFVGPGTAGYPLLAQGAGADPVFTPIDISTAAVTGILPLGKFSTTPTFTTVTTTGNAAVGAILTVTGASNLNGAVTMAAGITDSALPTVAAGTGKHFVCVDSVSGVFYRGTGASCN